MNTNTVTKDILAEEFVKELATVGFQMYSKVAIEIIALSLENNTSGKKTYSFQWKIMLKN